MTSSRVAEVHVGLFLPFLTRQILALQKLLGNSYQEFPIKNVILSPMRWKDLTCISAYFQINRSICESEELFHSCMSQLFNQMLSEILGHRDTLWFLEIDGDHYPTNFPTQAGKAFSVESELQEIQVMLRIPELLERSDLDKVFIPSVVPSEDVTISQTVTSSYEWGWEEIFSLSSDRGISHGDVISVILKMIDDFSQVSAHSLSEPGIFLNGEHITGSLDEFRREMRIVPKESYVPPYQAFDPYEITWIKRAW